MKIRHKIFDTKYKSAMSTPMNYKNALVKAMIGENQFVGTDDDACRLVANKLKVDSSTLYVVSREGNLRLVTSDEGFVRGVLVHENGSIIAQFPPHPAIITGTAIESDEKDIAIVEESGKKLTHRADEITFFRGFSGTHICVGYWDGVIRVFTASNLNLKNSRWCGRSEKFLTIMERLGVDPKSLFDMRKRSSCWYHIFILVDNQLLLADQFDAKQGFAVYLGAQESFDKKTKRFDNIDDALREPADMTTTFPDLRKWDGKPFIYRNSPITTDEAHKHLVNGWYQEEVKAVDPRLSLGEFVIGKIGDKYVKILHPGFKYRNMLCHDQPSRPAALATLLTHTESDTLAPYLLDKDELKKGKFVFAAKNYKDELDKNSELRRQIICDAFLWSVNTTDKELVKKLLDTKIDVKNLAMWLAELFSERYLMLKNKEPGYSANVYHFLSDAFNQIKNRIKVVPRERKEQKEMMYKFLVDRGFNDQEAQRLNKARAFVDEQLKRTK